jgi:uncharacterized repeat protein (TIGR01451 family)
MVFIRENRLHPRLSASHPAICKHRGYIAFFKHLKNPSDWRHSNLMNMTSTTHGRWFLICLAMTAVLLFAIPLTSLLALPPADQPAGATAVQLININPAQLFDDPVDITHAGDGRLFIAEQGGLIRVLARPFATNTAVTFLNIQDRVLSGGELGLLGLAFHPDYAQNGYFYVNYTHQETESSPIYTRISRFQVTADPNAADPASELILLQFLQPYTNHNGGDLAFAADGTLYVAVGDGGSSGDPQDNGQTPGNLLGSVLRLDVDGNGSAPDCGGGQAAYTIPANNPLNDGPGGNCDEIWAYGLRNPWRISFDRETQDLFIGDVGQGQWEEINYQPAASSGGENYGWRCYEGNHAYNLTGCSAGTAVYTFPVEEYSHANGRCSITGGFVYRGDWYPALTGAYLYADYCTGEIWSLVPDGGGWQTTPLLDAPFRIYTFGEDVNGELYVGGRDGYVYLVSDSAAANYLTIDLDAPLTAVANEPFTYTLTVTNTSLVTATNLTITNTMPTGAAYVSGGALVGDTVIWTVAELPPYSDVQVQWTATATQTVWNEAYGVQADGGITAVGQETAVTIINPRFVYVPFVIKP